MAKILVVDDKAIFRDPIAASLRLAGYDAITASDGCEALAAARRERPDLVLLDVAMPIMDGFTCLRQMRDDVTLASTPVILLTAISDKDMVMRARDLGAAEYLLKSRFSLKELLGRVVKHVGTAAGGPADPEVLATAGIETRPAPPVGGHPDAETALAAPPGRSLSSDEKPESATRGPAWIPAVAADVAPLLTPAQFTARTEQAMQGKSLSGVVAEVLRLASIPDGNLTDLAEVIARDSLLSARVLRVANSAAYAAGRGMIASIPDAVRRIGWAAVRNIATSLGIFDLMPKQGGDGFNLVRCWQHSLAVAQLTERLAGDMGEQDFGTAYLVGLCHDLGEILLRTEFAREYQVVLDRHVRSNVPLPELERQMLGMRHADLILTILRSLGLPESIRTPIERFHQPAMNTEGESLALTRALLLADCSANGMLLASGSDAVVAPFTRAHCKRSVGREDPDCPDADTFRANIMSLTGALASGAAAQEALQAPLYGRRDVKLWVARDPELSSFNPVTTALSALCDVNVQPRLPACGELTATGHAGLVVIACAAFATGFTATDIATATVDHPQGESRVLWVTAKAEGPSVPSSPGHLGTPRRSLSLRTLEEFLARMAVPPGSDVA